MIGQGTHSHCRSGDSTHRGADFHSFLKLDVDGWLRQGLRSVLRHPEGDPARRET